VDEAMRHDEQLREKTANNQYPHGVYNELIDALAVECGAMPDLEKLKKEDPTVYNKLWNHGTIPSHFCFNQNKDMCMRVVDEAAEIIDKVYTYDEGEEIGSHLSTIKLARKFSKNFKLPLRLFKE
jgi:hypothetical protein